MPLSRCLCPADAYPPRLNFGQVAAGLRGYPGLDRAACRTGGLTRNFFLNPAADRLHDFV